MIFSETYTLASGSDALSITINSSDNVFWTVLAGVIVFVAGQLFIELFIRPWQRYKEIRAKVAYCLVMYANDYGNPMEAKKFSESLCAGGPKAEKYMETGDELRKLASEMAGFAEEKWFFHPSKRKIHEVAANLIGLSNNLVSPHPDIAADHNSKRARQIRELLRLKVIDN